MRTRMGAERAGEQQQALSYNQRLKVGDVAVTLVPAGHVLGAAQVLMEYGGSRAVVSGDYKRQPDPTCAPFEPVACDVFVTEATFGLPIFRHPDAGDEIGGCWPRWRCFRSARMSSALCAGQMPAGDREHCANAVMTRRFICTARIWRFARRIARIGR